MLSNLFQPGHIGKMSIKNRIVMPPMLMGYGTADGYVTERMKDYLEERAKGGVGLVIVEAVGVRFEGKVFPYSVNCYDESHLPGLTELADAIKKHGARAAVQIGDGGRNTRTELTGKQPMGPSPIATHKRNPPREMTLEDIEEMVNRFARSISLAKRAGFEGAEMHAAHVYFLNQFLSAATNKRQDKYGSSIENRARILVEIIQAGRKLVGDDFPIWVRINAEEPGEEEGITIDEAKKISMIAEKAGYAAISVSCGGNHYEASMGSVYFAPGYIVPFAEQIKKAVNIPVIVVGRITAQLGEKIISAGKADFVAIGRGLMVDPELPNKAKKGRLSDIVPCISCMNCVHRGVLRDTPITCTVNAALGREKELRLLPVEKGKNVLIVGGGPAGLEAARVAARRGHRVTLLHRGPKLGGKLRLLTVAPHKGPFRAWIDYMEGQMGKSGVDVKLGTGATAAVIEGFKPDVVIAATGLATTGDGGADLHSDQNSMITVQGVLDGRKVGDRVVIAGDDGMACEAADLLSEMGKKVTIIGEGKKIAPEMLNIIRSVLLRRLKEKGVVMLTEVKMRAVTPSGVEVIEKDGGGKELVADTVVLGNNYRLDTNLISPLRKQAPRIYLIGGCRGLREQQDAVADGYMAGWLA